MPVRVRVFLKGNWSPDRSDNDEGFLIKLLGDHDEMVSLVDGSGGSRRTYPRENIARIEWLGD